MPALKSLYPDREATLKARRHGVSHGMLEELSPGARRVWELIEDGGVELATVLIKAHLHILDGLRRSRNSKVRTLSAFVRAQQPA